MHTDVARLPVYDVHTTVIMTAAGWGARLSSLVRLGSQAVHLLLQVSTALLLRRCVLLSLLTLLLQLLHTIACEPQRAAPRDGLALCGGL